MQKKVTANISGTGTMKDYLISLYIDDEMDLPEKIDFVNEVSADPVFYQEAIALIKQEMLLHQHAADSLSAIMPAEDREEVQKPHSSLFSFLHSRATGLVAMIFLAFLAFTTGRLSMPFHAKEPVQANEMHRFVLYLPQTESVKILGSFTNWQPIPMEPVGNSGYWQLTLKLSKQEHRYSFVTADGHKLIDPTVPLQEKDDFGGANSIIDLSVTI